MNVWRKGIETLAQEMVNGFKSPNKLSWRMPCASQNAKNTHQAK